MLNSIHQVGRKQCSAQRLMVLVINTLIGSEQYGWPVDQRTKAKVVVRAADTVADPAAIEKLAEIRHAGLRTDRTGPSTRIAEGVRFEYLEGCSLAQMADQAGGALTQEILMPIILARGKILGFLHRQGEFPLVYLDIKPDHILIGSNFDAVSLIDFGASQLLDGQIKE